MEINGRSWEIPAEHVAATGNMHMANAAALATWRWEPIGYMPNNAEVLNLSGYQLKGLGGIAFAAAVVHACVHRSRNSVTSPTLAHARAWAEFAHLAASAMEECERTHCHGVAAAEEGKALILARINYMEGGSFEDLVAADARHYEIFKRECDATHEETMAARCMANKAQNDTANRSAQELGWPIDAKFFEWLNKNKVHPDVTAAYHMLLSQMAKKTLMEE